MASDQEDRIGTHVVETVTEPVQYLVLERRFARVRIPLRKIIQLSTLDRVVDHLGSYDFSWAEKQALEQAGLAVSDLRGGVWPTAALLSAIQKTNL